MYAYSTGTSTDACEQALARQRLDPAAGRNARHGRHADTGLQLGGSGVVSKHFLHRTARLFEKAREDDQVAGPPPLPLDETRLAAEIARIIEKRPQRSEATAKPAPAHWLGEEDDRAFVERHAVATAALAATPSPAIEDEENDTLDDDPAAPHFGEALPEHSAALSAVWVKKARRQRWRARFRDLAGWTVSIVISLALIIAVSVAMFGWNNGGAILKQLQVKSITVWELQPNS